MKSSAFILEAVYQKAFSKDVSAATFEDRLLAQKTVYLLQEMGLNIGDYGYRWYKHGPYSQEVQDDIFVISNNLALIKSRSDLLNFNELAVDILDRFKCMINSRIVYDEPLWLEAVASIHYLLKYKVSLPTREKVIKTFQSLKPHLDNKKANELAYDIAQGI